MAIVVEDSALAINHNALTATATLTPVEGRLMVALGGHYWRNNTEVLSITTPASSYTQRIVAGVDFQVMLAGLTDIWHAGDGNDVTLAASVSADRGTGLAVLELSGASGFDKGSAVSSGSSSTCVIPPTTAVAENGSLAIAFFLRNTIAEALGTPSYGKTGTAAGSWTELAKAQYGGGAGVEIYMATAPVNAGETIGCTLSGMTSARQIGGLIMVISSAASAPVNTVPTKRVCTTSLFPTALSGIDVTEGASPVTSVRLFCTTGRLAVTLSGSVVVTSGANDSNDLTLSGGASTAEFKTVLGTVTYQGADGVSGLDQLGMVCSDGTLTAQSQWEILNDPTTILIEGDSADIIATFEDLQAKLYPGYSSALIQIESTDTSTTPIVIDSSFSVEVAEAPPVITTQPTNQQAYAPDAVTFAGVATGYATIEWFRDDGSGPVMIPGETGLSYTLTPTNKVADDGAVFFFVAKTASGLSTFSDQAVLTIPTTRPIADAGADQSLTVGQTANLSGAGSSDEEDDPLTYAWTIASAPSGNGAAIVNGATATPTFSPIVAGTYVLQLIVNDGTVDSLPDTVSIILALPDVVPMFVAAYRAPTVPGDRRSGLMANDTLASVWKYPNDIYDVAVDWSGPQVLPAGATALSTLVVSVIDPELGSPNDVSISLIVDYGASPVTGWGTDGLVSWVTIQGGTKGKTYRIIFRQTFDNGQIREKYVDLVIRRPRKFATNLITKYPNDKFPVPVQWDGRQPRAATVPALVSLTAKAFTDADVDESATYIDGAYVAKKISVATVKAGSGGDSRLLEFAVTFSNGRKFHEYAMLTVEVPPA